MDKIIMYDPLTCKNFLANEEVLKEVSKVLNEKLDKNGFVYTDDPDVIKILGAPIYPRRKFVKIVKRP